MIKITFDYDGCLSQPKIQELAKKKSCLNILKRYENFKLYAIKYKFTLNNNNNCKNI